MGQRGPVPIPSPILKVRGTYRPDKRRNEPQPKPGRLPCPKELSKDAKAVWRQVVPMLDQMGVLTRIDGKALARYCHQHVRYWRSVHWIEEHGESYPIYDVDQNGKKRLRYMQPWPEVAVINRLGSELTRLEDRFGMTPSARTRIQVPVQKPTDPEKERFFRAR